MIERAMSDNTVIAGYDKPYGFLMFSEGREKVHWEQMGRYFAVSKMQNMRNASNICSVPFCTV